MILVFIFLGIIILISLIFFVLTISTIKIRIENLYIKNFKINNEYIIFFQIYIMNKLKIFSLKINGKKINKIVNYEKMKKLRNNNIKPNIGITKILSELKLTIEKMNLKIDLGIDDASLTSITVAILSSIISVLLPVFTINDKMIKYDINPIYNNNTFKLYLDSIISFKIVHIMYVIYIMLKKGSIKYERTSNRRAYANSYE